MTSPHLRVLVVEDETLIRWSIAETLAHKGHAVVEASTGTAAVQALDDAVDPIDVVLLDYRLPDSNDLNLLATIRRKAPDSAIVMMTAFGTPDMTDRALELGAYRVIGKPFDILGIESLVLEAHEARSAAAGGPLL